MQYFFFLFLLTTNAAQANKNHSKNINKNERQDKWTESSQNHIFLNFFEKSKKFINELHNKSVKKEDQIQ